MLNILEIQTFTNSTGSPDEVEETTTVYHYYTKNDPKAVI